MKNLFKGPVVVIDDEVSGEPLTGKADIKNLIDHIKSKSYPCATLAEYPDDIDKFVENLHSVAFIILDWRMDKIGTDTDTAGVMLPDNVGDQAIEFIKNVKERLFIPVFVFTNETIEDVKQKLSDHGLFDRENERLNFIFVREKAALVDQKLFDEIDQWLSESASVYVLKEWESEYQRAKSSMFQNFYDKSHSWPKILWNVYKADDGFPSEGLSGVLTRNLATRMSPIQFNEEIISKPSAKPNRDVIRRVLEGERFVSEDNLHKNSLAPGDIFQVDEKFAPWNYLINVRPSCDTVLMREGNSNPDLFFLRGRKAELKKASWNKTHYKEKESSFIIPCVIEGEVIEFDLKSFHSKSWYSVRGKRIGRLLDPHLNRMLQKFSTSIFRQGVPSSPKLAYFDD